MIRGANIDPWTIDVSFGFKGGWEHLCPECGRIFFVKSKRRTSGRAAIHGATAIGSPMTEPVGIKKRPQLHKELRASSFMYADELHRAGSTLAAGLGPAAAACGGGFDPLRLTGLHIVALLSQILEDPRT